MLCPRNRCVERCGRGCQADGAVIVRRRCVEAVGRTGLVGGVTLLTTAPQELD